MVDRPWQRYDRDTLPAGLSYPVGRSVVECELLTAGAAVTSLSLHRPDRHGADTVVSVHWSGDVGRRIADVIPDGGSRLMTVMAVPSQERQWIRDQLQDRWLTAAAEWVAGIDERGDAWRSAEHRWLLRRLSGELRLSHT